MCIGDVSFCAHAYVVKNAPFQLLLRRPFHSLLLTKLEDNSDGSVNLTIYDPADQSRIVQVPTRAWCATVGFITTLALLTHPASPHMTTPE